MSKSDLTVKSSARKLYIPNGYTPKLDFTETQDAIKMAKDVFQANLSAALNLRRVTAPVIVTRNCGINDDLNGVERKVDFTMKEIGGTAEVVQSLAKWKRMALYRYGFAPDTGLYTDMNAIRRDDEADNLHSIFVDQWDWERVITKEERNMEFLKEIVRTIVFAVVGTKNAINMRYSALRCKLSGDVAFVTTSELEEMYPSLSPKERENAFVKEHKTAFVMQIGGKLKDGKPHDGRAPDYDDWALNGDILFFDETLNCALEVSSMGIRVDSESLDRQLTLCHADDRRQYEYHQLILNGTMPLTIGGGIGQSRLCMLLLEKAHIGEVQVSIWPEDMLEACRENGIPILQ